MGNKYRQHKISLHKPQIYYDHLLHMTSEGLHDKAEIADELAVRDIRIADLEKCLSTINGICIGNITMTYDIDGDHIGRIIYEATGIDAESLHKKYTSPTEVKP